MRLMSLGLCADDVAIFFQSPSRNQQLFKVRAGSFLGRDIGLLIHIGELTQPAGFSIPSHHLLSSYIPPARSVIHLRQLSALDLNNIWPES